MYRKDPLAIGRQEAANTYLRYADVGTIALIILLPMSLLADDEVGALVGKGVQEVAHFVVMLCALALFIVLMTLFKKSLRDEFIEGLWNAGTGAAFVAAVIYTYVGSFIAGAADDFAKRAGTSVPNWHELLMGQAITVAIIAFFIGFQVKRWRNR